MAMPLLPRKNGIDGELNGIAPLHGDVISLNQPLGSYRIHGANDFAQRQLNVEKFDDYLRHSEKRLDFIRDHYRSHGHVIADDVLDRDLKYQEYALVVEKLGKVAGHPSRHLLRVAVRAIMSAMRSPHTLDAAGLPCRYGWRRLLIAPSKLAASLVEQRFIPGRRSGWITRLATLRQAVETTGEKLEDRCRRASPPKTVLVPCLNGSWHR